MELLLLLQIERRQLRWFGHLTIDRAVSGKSHWTEDRLERYAIYLSAALGTSGDSPGGAEICDWGNSSLC